MLGFFGRHTKVNRCLAEGRRRRFLERLAGIQSGAECERLAPVLSAFADGEAGAEEVAVLRPHLRSCLACRARLRDYRGAPARAAALAPPLAVGSLLASARDLFSSAASWLSERSASLAIRWHPCGAEARTARPRTRLRPGGRRRVRPVVVTARDLRG